VALQIDAEEQDASELGTHLSSLESLKLNGSRVCTLRSLGTKFTNVKFLWLCNCELQDLDGVGVLPNLEELYVSFFCRSKFK
jgi:Leucine-rich repeat (LRR) protein